MWGWVGTLAVAFRDHEEFEAHPDSYLKRINYHSPNAYGNKSDTEKSRSTPSM